MHRTPLIPRIIALAGRLGLLPVARRALSLPLDHADTRLERAIARAVRRAPAQPRGQQLRQRASVRDELRAAARADFRRARIAPTARFGTAASLDWWKAPRRAAR